MLHRAIRTASGGQRSNLYAPSNEHQRQTPLEQDYHPQISVPQTANPSTQRLSLKPLQQSNPAQRKQPLQQHQNKHRYLFIDTKLQSKPGTTSSEVPSSEFASPLTTPVMHRLRLKKTSSNLDELESPLSERRSLFSMEVEKRLKRSVHVAAESIDPKWTELKISGTNILPRSRASLAFYKNKIFVYGGYEIKSGCIDDFWQIDLNLEQALWKRVPVKGKNRPGPKMRHSCVVFEDKMFMFGGQHAPMRSSRDVWSYDFIEKQWTLESLNKSEDNSIATTATPPCLDSHSCVLVGKAMLVFFGYSTETGEFSNAVYSFDCQTKEWEKLYKGCSRLQSVSAHAPSPRFESAVATVRTQPRSIFAFGGSDGFSRLNDLWSFNLDSKTYQSISCQTSTPPPLVMKIIEFEYLNSSQFTGDMFQIMHKKRNNDHMRFVMFVTIRSGHSLVGDEGKLILFGGIHDITWELNDVCVFDLNTLKWTILESDSVRTQSPTKQQLNTQSTQRSSDTKTFRGHSSSNQKRKTMTSFSPLKRSQQRLPSFSQTMTMLNTSSEAQFQSGYSVPHVQSSVNGATSILLEKKRKEFEFSKAQMLSTFEIEESQLKTSLQSYREHSPVSEAMKNSISAVGNPMPSLKPKEGKFTEFGRVTISRFLEPLSTQTKYRKGKQPCARDGHRMVSNGIDSFILFGGDRHKMSFSDVFFLDIKELFTKLND